MFFNQNPVPRGQMWFIEKMKACGYTSNAGGVCFGVANMGMQAILANDIETFDNRIKSIATIPTNKINHQIDKGITAFFEGVELYQQAYLYPHLFEPVNSPSEQSTMLTAPIALSKALDEQGGIVGNFTDYYGAYHKNDISEYFNILTSIMKQASHPVVLNIGGGDHAITVGYVPSRNQWLFIDANQLPTQYTSDERVGEIAEKVLSALSKNDIAIFSTKIYGIKSKV